jgi:hypothetical protein
MQHCLYNLWYLTNLKQLCILGYKVAHFVEALLYKSEDREFDPDGGHWDFLMTSLHPTIALG